MHGWFFSGHSAIDVTNGLSPRFPCPNWIRRHWGFGDPTLGLTHVHLVPVGSGTITCSCFTQWTVGETSRGCLGLASTRGGRPTALAGSGCLSTLLGCCGHSTLARGGRPYALARGGGLSTLTGGWLSPVRPPPEAPVDGISTWAGFFRSGLPLGWVSGSLGTGSPAR